MIDKIKSLALILSRMNVLYERVLVLLDLERNHLVRLDYESIYTAFREKDEVLSAIRGLDRDRLRIQDQFAIVMGQRAEDLTLKILGEALVAQDPISAVEGERLLRIRSTLENTIARTKEKISVNNRFIEKSVENLRGIAETVTQAAQGLTPAMKRKQGGIYTGKAKIEQKAPTLGKIFEKTL